MSMVGGVTVCRTRDGIADKPVNVSDAAHECQTSARPECDACSESGFAGAGNVHIARAFILSSF
jgi:hypothetical protein